MISIDYAYEMIIIQDTITETTKLVHTLKQAAGNIALYVNAKTIH